MTPEQKALITVSFGALASDMETSAALFYARLFEQHPSLRPLFTGNMKRQGQKFMEMMNALIGSLDRLDHLVPLFWQMGKRHGGYGAKEVHYAGVQEALLWTLEQRLNVPLPTETRAAWAELFALIARIMQQAAEEGSIPRALPPSPDEPYPAA